MFDDLRLILVWSLTYLFILGVWGWLAFRLYGGLASKKWLRVSGKILRSRLRKWSFLGKNDQYPDIVYQYLVNGKWYTSKNITFALARPNTVEMIEKYEAYALVVVFYHPGSPGISVLKPGLPKFDLLFLSFCFAWASFLVGAGLWTILVNLP
ncbi:MAG: DUF3592 domain-containing protein [Anaerolineales bacterium]|nr:DUF3592 domain-containing protein [Anaerolineales bacterium]